MKLESGIKALRAIAEPTRLRLLHAISRGEISVEELCAVLGQSQPRISRHLRVLVDSGLVSRFRDRHRIYYCLPRDGEEIALVRDILARIDSDDAVLQADLRRTANVRAARERKALSMTERQPGQVVRIQPETKALEAALTDLLGAGRIGDVLDVGCGSGALLCQLAPRADRAVGLDTSEKMRLLARARVQRAGLSHVTLRHGDMHDLPVTDSSFDIVVLDEVYRWTDEPRRLLREARRVLRLGGTLLVYDRIPRVPASLTEDFLAPAEIDRLLLDCGFVPGMRQWLQGPDPDIALLSATAMPGESTHDHRSTGT